MIDEGRGRAILVLHGGMGDETSWSRVTDLLRDRFRVVRLTRRQYELDVPRKVTIRRKTPSRAASGRNALSLVLSPFSFSGANHSFPLRRTT